MTWTNKGNKHFVCLDDGFELEVAFNGNYWRWWIIYANVKIVDCSDFHKANHLSMAYAINACENKYYKYKSEAFKNATELIGQGKMTIYKQSMLGHVVVQVRNQCYSNENQPMIIAINKAIEALNKSENEQ